MKIYNVNNILMETSNYVVDEKDIYMKTIDGYSKDGVFLVTRIDRILIPIKIEHALEELYYQFFVLPTDKELKNEKIKTTQKEIMRKLSKCDTHVPLYDARASNMHLVEKKMVYDKVMNHDHRFPDKLIVEYVKNKRDTIMKKIELMPELMKNILLTRRLKKTNMMLEFLDFFDKDILYSTYLKVFYDYSSHINNATYTCIRRSFMPQMPYMRPYYERDEILKIGMNMDLIEMPPNTDYNDYKYSLSNEKFREICDKIQSNDVSSELLVIHNNYIIDNGMAGLVQYYTLQGSAVMNVYMRVDNSHNIHNYIDDVLQENILKMWKLVLNAPEFDNDYILYRFIADDHFLSHLSIGDIYADYGFTSTTRDPFYQNSQYEFGSILIKIRVPKNVRGVGLSLEMASHFKDEQEIILAPRAELELISKNEQCKYYHPNEEITKKIKKRYEFKWIRNGKIEFKPRIIYAGETHVIDFKEIKKSKGTTIEEKINTFRYSYLDPLNRVKCEIGKKTFYVMCEWYNSEGVYGEMYELKIKNGFSIYSIYDGYILFMIELGSVDDVVKMIVNYHNKFSDLDREDIMGDENFILFVASIASYFDIPYAKIYSDYINCNSISQKINNENIYPRVMNNGGPINMPRKHKQINEKKDSNDSIIKNPRQLPRAIRSQSINKMLDQMERDYSLLDDDEYQNYPPPSHNYDKNYFPEKKQRSFAEKDGNKKDTPSERNVNNAIDDDATFTLKGGIHCVDFYNYLKYNKKKYYSTNLLYVELKPKFSYDILDDMRSISPLKILNRDDRDEIYQTYVKIYKSSVSKEKDNVADFYIWMIENKCHFIDILTEKIKRIYKPSENPFENDYYILDGITYLYNRKIENVYNAGIKMNYNEKNSRIMPKKDEKRTRIAYK
jgi:hypothetical protein